MLTMLSSDRCSPARSIASESASMQWTCHCVLLSRDYADFLTALSTSVLPSDQIAPGTLWLAAMTSSNDFSIQLQSSSVITSGGSHFMVCLACARTWATSVGPLYTP